MSETKICKTCDLEKPLTDYYIAKRNRQGVTTSCKSCMKSKSVSTPLAQTIFFDRGTRICTICKSEKTFDSFYKSPKEKSGVGQRCKECSKDVRKAYLLKPKKALGSFKKCGKCKVSYPLGDFVKDNSKQDGLSSTCRNCVKEYRENNKPLFRQLKRQYTANNKEHILNYSRAYTKDRLLSDPLFKLNTNIRGLIIQTFKNTNHRKKSKTVEILGTSMEDFKKHIESQFLHWMDWSKHRNYEKNGYKRTIDLDHIIPISYAKTEDEIYLLNHWSNFQPLCSKVNRDNKKAKVYPCTNLELMITFWEDSYEKLKNN